ncbi:MAG: glycosyltransferase family 2 protein [Phycisphaerales bacterium]|jgi:dolichol-phosphate mannosyltransferase|nr:glycosyltransferase family 2 protein [Phycisphaerales bacterium]
MPQTYHHLTPRPTPSLLSIVIPAYNEQEVIPHLRPRLEAFLKTLPCAVEVLFVNDGSSDRTLELLMDWASVDSRIKVAALARNFGHQAAVTAGLDLAVGDAVVVMDADLQDPPEVVLEMIREYGRGYDVVYGQRASRQNESAFKRLTAWGFYRFMRRFIHPDLPADTGDFRLVSRECLDALKAMRETHRFLRGMVAWVGFPQTAVRFDRPARAAGSTKYPLSKMIRFAWTAAVSFSPLPLRLSLGLGIITASLGVIVSIIAVVSKLTGHTTAGWTSQVILVCMVGGAILVSNGILGEYIGRIFEQSKGRPLYIVSRTMNLPKPPLPAQQPPVESTNNTQETGIHTG